MFKSRVQRPLSYPGTHTVELYPILQFIGLQKLKTKIISCGQSYLDTLTYCKSHLYGQTKGISRDSTTLEL